MSKKPVEEISTFRRILPQILASSAKNLLLLDLGMSVAFPTILIASLKGLKAHDNNDFLSFDNVQASWFGKHPPPLSSLFTSNQPQCQCQRSPEANIECCQFFHSLRTASIAFIFQPIGSVASGIVLEPLGRKRSMILVNFPHIVGWLLLHYATSVTQLYIAGEFGLLRHCER